MRALAALVLAACAAHPRQRIEQVQVAVLAHDTTWTASVGDRAAGRDIHVPLGAKVQLSLASRDSISLFAAPGLGLRDFAAPGLPAKLEFRADKEGTYELRGDELCGRPHGDRTRGRIVVEDPSAYLAWTQRRPE